MMLRPTEHQITAAIVQRLWLAAKAGRIPGIFFHPANEGARSPGQGWKMKREGMMPGVSDLVIVRDAAFLEIKGYSKAGQLGRQNDNQKAFQALCEEKGLPYLCTHDQDAAWEFLEQGGFVHG